MRILAVALAIASVASLDDARPPARAEPVRLAGIGDTVKQKFLQLVNDSIMGSIRPGAVHFKAPSGIKLDDAILLDPNGKQVARVQHAEATLALSALLAGDIVLKRVILDGPALDLRYTDGKLNLLEALTPRKKKKPPKQNNTEFRIDSIVADGGAFTFTDQKNVTVRAEGISASASLDVDLEHDLVIVDVHDPHVKSGAVELQNLTVPVADVGARLVRVLKDRVELDSVTGRASGALVNAGGTVVVTAPGSLDLRGVVDAPKNAWPERLKKLELDTPPVRASVTVLGRFDDPKVHVDGTFGPTLAYGYSVDGGRGVVEVTKELVHIEDGSYVKAGGVVAVAGTVKVANLALALKAKANDVPLARALQPAKLEPAPKGSVSGRADISGVVDGKAPIVVSATFTGRHPRISAVDVKDDVNGTAHVTVEPKHVRIDAASLDAPHLKAQVSGDVFTGEERVDLTVNASADDATSIVPSVPPEVRAGHATFAGTITGPYKEVKVEGHATATDGVAYGVPLRDADAHVVAGTDLVVVDDVRAHAAGGLVTAPAPVRIALKGNHAISGTVRVAGADLARIRSPAGEPLPLAGTADAEAVLGGPYDDPTVRVRAAAGGLVVADEDLGQAVARGVVTKELVAVDDAAISGGVAEARSDDIRLALPKLVVEGHVHVDTLDLARVAHAKAAKLAGVLQGLVVVSGDVRAPDIDAHLTAENVSAGAQHYGAGAVDLHLAPESLPGRPAPGHVVTVATQLGSATGRFDVRAAYAIEREVVNASAHVEDVDLQPFTQMLGSAVAPLQGFASGTVEASGPLAALDLRVHLRSPALAVERQTPREETAAGTTTPPAPAPGPAAGTLRQLGAVVVDARMDAGSLNARVCAFPAPGAAKAQTVGATVGAAAGAASGAVEGEASPCANGERVWAFVVGDVDAAHRAFDLAVDGEVEEQDLEDVFPALAKRGLSVSAKARASAQIARAEGRPVDVRAQATLLQASVQPPGALRADLVGTSEVLWADGRLRLTKPARFRSPNGDVNVVVDGSVGTADIALTVNGTVALGIAKAFTPQIANAKGTALTSLSVRGRYAEGVSVDGALTPQAGAVVTPRALAEPITFLGGSVRFAPVSGSPEALIRVTADELHARIGDGELTLKGSVDARTSRTSEQGLVARWRLAASGTNIAVKLPSGHAEGSADLSLVGDEAAPVLKGRVEVTDGLYRKTLELRNFVLQAPPEKESEPLWQTLAPIGLENLQLDVAASLSNFRTRANVANFDADLLLRGNLQLTKTLRVPQIDGAIDAEEGTVDFPRARFEVEEMQVEFPPSSSGKPNPVIHMTADAELPPGAAGTNDTEIPVELTLDGDLEKGLQLGLTATEDPQHQWTQSDLLGLILFGRPLANTVSGGVDTSIAVRALMSEATAPITQEIEELAKNSLGVQIEIDPSGWRWEIGRRLQLEGPGLLVNQPTQPSPAGGETYLPGAATPGTTSTTLGGAPGVTSTAAAVASPGSAEDAVRLHFLIFDPFHIGPVELGKNLSLVGSTSSIGQDLRLSLRLCED